MTYDLSVTKKMIVPIYVIYVLAAFLGFYKDYKVPKKGKWYMIGSTMGVICCGDLTVWIYDPRKI